MIFCTYSFEIRSVVMLGVAVIEQMFVIPMHSDFNRLSISSLLKKLSSQCLLFSSCRSSLTFSLSYVFIPPIFHTCPSSS